MATDIPRRRTPLGPLAELLKRTCSGPRFSCREDPFRVITDIRCAASAVSVAAETMGGARPAVSAMARVGPSYVVGLGPNWWMVDAPDGSAPLRGATHVSAVDVSAQYTTLVLVGSAVPEVLAHGTSIDLHPDYFVGHAAVQTLLAKARITLARAGHDEYRLWVQASYARYLAAWLMDASAEHR
jgi:sarcosine oxidase subunit gamma